MEPIEISGERVVAPTEKICRPRVELPEVQLREKGRGYRILIERARGLQPIRTAVVHPVDAVSLVAAIEAAKKGLIVPVLVGPEKKIRMAAEQAKVLARLGSCAMALLLANKTIIAKGAHV